MLHEVHIKDAGPDPWGRGVVAPCAGLPLFERKIHEVAEKFPDQYAFEFTGPWAPFSFVELDLQAA